jgi:hypothetical protein
LCNCTIPKRSHTWVGMKIMSPISVPKKYISSHKDFYRKHSCIYRYNKHKVTFQKCHLTAVSFADTLCVSQLIAKLEPVTSHLCHLNYNPSFCGPNRW